MAALFSGGLLLAFSLLIGLVLTIVGMFFGHIILFDSIFFAVLSSIAANMLLHLHPALSLLVGIAVLLFLFWVQHTRFGFWIVGGLLSFFWAFLFSIIAYDATHKDMVWTYVVMGLGFVIMMLLHLKARSNDI